MQALAFKWNALYWPLKSMNCARLQKMDEFDRPSKNGIY